MAKAAAKKPQLCVQMYTLRDHCGNAKDVAQSLKKIARIGYRLAQVSGPINQVPGPELAKMAADAGVALVGSHIGYAEWTTNYDKWLAFLKAIGCRYTAIPSLPEEMRDSAAAWKKSAKLFERLGAKLAKDGVVLQYHNHHFEFTKFGGRTGLEILYANAGPKYLQAEIDTCWVNRGGGDPAQWVLDVKGRMDQVHLKDTVMVGTEAKFAEIGEGNLNWPAVMAACRKAGVKHYIVEQDGDWRGGDPFKSLAISHRFLSEQYGLA